MAKRVRKDLPGAVWIGGSPYFAGDALPDDSVVGDHVLEQQPVSSPKPEPEPPASSPKPEPKPPVRRPRKKHSEA